MDEHIPISSEQLDLQYDLLNNKIIKCHGNRPLQCFKRKCRAKGMNNQAMEMLMSIKKGNKLVHQNNQQTHQEDMDDSFTINTESNMLMLLENQVRSKLMYDDINHFIL
jgi:hypothetical protein